MTRFRQSLGHIRPSIKPQQGGFSMVEVLVALVITTIGLLGFAALQVRALNATEDAYVRTQATAFAQEILERIRISGTSEVWVGGTSADLLAAYASDAKWTGSVSAQNCETAVCSQTQLANYDIAQIRKTLDNATTLNYIPNGSALVSRPTNSAQWDVYVAWGDVTATDCRDKAVAKSGIIPAFEARSCIKLAGF